MHASSRILSVLLITAALQAAAAGGTVYRWTDANGNLVVSDRPPASGIDYELVSTSTGNVVDAPAEAPAASGGASSDKATEPAEQQKGRVAQFSAPAKDPKLCEQARSNLTILQDKPRIRFTDESGEVRFMSDDERGLEIERTLDAIDAYCE